MAFCILTLEYWVLLVPGMLFTLALLAKREERPIRWAAKEALMGALLLAATAGILWPPFLFSLSYLNTVAIYLKFMVSPLPTEEFSRHWLRSLLAAHPFLLSAFAASGAGLFALPALRSAGKKSPLAEYAPWVPLILFALGFIVLNMRVAHMKPLYAAHLVPSLAVLAALLFGLAWGRLGAWRWGALAVLAIGFSIQARDHFTRFQLKPWEGQVASIREETRGKQVLAVFNYPFFEYYLDGARVTAGWTTEEELAAAKADLAQGRYDVVCGLTDATRSSWPGFPSEAELKAWGYAPGASQVGALTAHVWTKSDAAKGVGSAAN
jgi:hypothetical protein